GGRSSSSGGQPTVHKKAGRLWPPADERSRWPGATGLPASDTQNVTEPGLQRARRVRQVRVLLRLEEPAAREEREQGHNDCRDPASRTRRSRGSNKKALPT